FFSSPTLWGRGPRSGGGASVGRTKQPLRHGRCATAPPPHAVGRRSRVKVASVLIPLPVPEAFDYEVPEALSVARGDQVAVPLGPRLIRGVVAEVFETTGSNRRLKAVEQ